MKVEFFNIDIDEESPVEVVNFRDKRFMNRAFETGITKSAVPHESVKYGATCRGGKITETIRFFGKIASDAIFMAGIVCFAIGVVMVLFGKWN